MAPTSSLVTVTSPVCFGDSAYWQTAPIVGGSNYVWYSRDGMFSRNGRSISVANLTRDSTLYLRVEQNGCSYTIDSAEVIVRTIPSRLGITGRQVWCAGDDLSLLAATPAWNYTWTAPSGATYNLSLIHI